MATIINSHIEEEFTYGLEVLKRRRPKKIVATLDTSPVQTTNRQLGPFPIALKPASGSTSDYLPHNTVGGHLVGLNFGGPHVDWNLVPMYGFLNNGGPWSKLESALFDEVYAPDTVGTATLTVTLDYSGTTDARIPNSIQMLLQYKTKNGQTHNWNPAAVVQQQPKLQEYKPTEGLQWHVFKWQHAMEQANWFVEDHVATSLGPKHFDYGKPLIVPARKFIARPYAVLDYMIYAQSQFQDYKAVLNNEAEFSEKQKNLIYQTNIAMNMGYIVSCAPDDYVWEKGTSSPQMDYHTEAFALTQKRGHLLWEGGHQKPEVDHIIPKGDKTKGSNAYSNAQVTSAFYNNQKRIAAGIPAIDILN